MEKGVKKVKIDEVPTVCKECDGKYEYVSHGKYVCTDCKSVAYDDFGKIRKFIEDNGPSTLMAIVKGTGVPLSKVNDFVSDGRMESPNNGVASGDLDKALMEAKKGKN